MYKRQTGTLISNDTEKGKIKAVAAKDNITAIKIKSSRMLLEMCIRDRYGTILIIKWLLLKRKTRMTIEALHKFEAEMCIRDRPELYGRATVRQLQPAESRTGILWKGARILRQLQP